MDIRRNIKESHEKNLMETEKFVYTKRILQINETGQDIMLEQDDLGCGDELAQGSDLDLVEGLEGEAFESEEELVDLQSDSCSKKKVDNKEGAEQIHIEEVLKIEWGLTKNGGSALHTLRNEMLRDRILYDQIYTDRTSIDGMFSKGIYANGKITGRIFSNEGDMDEMFSDIPDAGEALADKDGLSECDLFEQTEPTQIIDIEEKANGDTMMLAMEEGSDSSDLSSSSIEEEDDNMQMVKEKTEERQNILLSHNSSSQDLSTSIDNEDCSTDNSESFHFQSNQPSFSSLSSSSQPSETVFDDEDVINANPKYWSKDAEEHDHSMEERDKLFTSAACDHNAILNTDIFSSPSIIQQQPESKGQSSQNQLDEVTGQDKGAGLQKDPLTMATEASELTGLEEHLYEDTEPNIPAKDFLQNRKYFMTRSISVETPSKRLEVISSPKTGNGRLLLHPQSFYTDHCFLGDSRPVLTGSLGCLSQGPHASTDLAKVTRLDIPPPFELASITKRPIRKSSPSLPNEISATCKKPDFGFKRYLLPLRFLRKSDRRNTMDSRSVSSRSSSESSPQGSCKRLDLIRHTMGSPDLQRTPNCTPPLSPASFLYQKNRQKQGLNSPINYDVVSSIISMEPDHFLHSLFDPLPLSKPRSFSSPNTDSSEYENVQSACSHYENVQIRLLNPTNLSQRNQSSTNDTDGYVDMSSLPGFQGKSQSSDQETDSTYTFCSPNVRPDGTVGVSVGVACAKEKRTQTSDKLPVFCSRSFYSAKEFLDSEAQHIKTLQLLCETVKADERLMALWTEIPDIFTLHQHIYTLLETRIKEWEQNEGIAEIILAKKTEFSIFNSYINHYDEKINYLDKIQNTLEDAMSLKKQLLQVIVRVLQYRVLLTDYLNNLSPDSREFQDTQAALMTVSDVAYQANDSLKNGVDLQRLVHIEHSVLGLTDLIQPGRVFVKEGTLMKVSRKCKQPRHLFLMNDIMLYTYPQQDGKYRLINTLPLAAMEVSKPPVENAQNALKIEVKDISITLSTSSCVERESWFVTLNRTLLNNVPVSGVQVDCLESVEGPVVSLGENAPPLLSVSQVTVCMNCPSHFSLTNRRHHCHACGKVVCRDCCRNKFPLKYMKNRRAKVCDHCYTELRKHDDVIVPESSSRPFSAVFQNIHPTSLWKSRKGHATFNQVTGSDGEMSGTLQRCRNSKRSWRSLWFLLKDKVLYTYPQPEERVACETLPLLGFTVRSEVEGESSVFQLYHKSTLFYTFKAQDSHTAQRWVNAIEEATVL